MHCIEIINKNKKYSLYINKVKYLIGQNYNSKYIIENTLNAFFDGEKLSEYSEFMNWSYDVLIDDNNISIKDYQFININDTFSLVDNKKIVDLYVEKITSELEYTETYKTIEVLLEDLAYNISELSTDKIYPYELAPEISLSKKKLMKLIDFNFCKNEYLINTLDLDSNDVLVLKLKMCIELSKQADKKTIVFVSCFEVSEEIIELLNKIEGYVIVSCMFVPKNIPRSDIYLTDDIECDMIDENRLYELLMNSEKCLNIEEEKTYIYNRYLVNYFKK